MGSELWIVLLFALGLSLIVAEIFLVGVVLGLIGLTCMLVSIYFGFEKSAGLGWTLVVIAAASVPVLAFVWVKVINRVLAMKFTQTGYTSAQMQYKDLVGQEGVALTSLRPAGMARFGERKWTWCPKASKSSPTRACAWSRSKKSRCCARGQKVKGFGQDNRINW